MPDYIDNPRTVSAPDGVTLPAGWSITVHTEFDPDSTPYDADCYSPEDIAAWRNDEWHYADYVVTIVGPGGIELGTSCVGAVEDSFTNTDTGITWYAINDPGGYFPSLVSEALASALGTARTIAATVSEV